MHIVLINHVSYEYVCNLNKYMGHVYEQKLLNG